jgi:lysophospholipase L1-like esterase
VREPIPEPIALRLFPQLSVSRVGVVYDPHTYYRFRGDLTKRIPFAERPEGEWTFHTNSDGLREDADIAGSKPDLRVIVAGDSHTEGYCNNVESYPNLLEAGLAARHPGRSVEVLNTGKSGYSFYNYLGVLEKYLALKPDVFVMGVYGGNDFVESTTLHHYFQRTTRPVCEACTYDRMQERYPVVTPNIFLQAFLQLVYFRHHPEERAVGLEAACAVTAEVQRVARANGVRFVALYIPPMTDAQPQYLGAVLDDAIRLFEMKPDDLSITNRLADEWLADARARGIECLDLREEIAGTQRQLYWDRDHHLNLGGNRVVAAALIPIVDGSWH